MKILLSGLVGLALAVWGLMEDIGFIAQPFYAWAWWSAILVLDGLTSLRRGSSILTSRRELLFPLLIWSVTFWFFFELLNLRLQNWYYVGVFARGSGVDLVKGSLFGVVSFATVFLGIFETFDALGGRADDDARPRALPSWTSYSIQAAGALMVGLAMVLPRYLAPLVWGSVTLLLDPWNYRQGARSILGDVEAGSLRTPNRLLIAGFLCGLLWESFNFFSPQKWIYTVRGLEELKLFEMPLLGFLGFPALALDAFSFFAFVSYALHGNRTWENSEDVATRLAPRGGLSPWIFALTLPLHAALWLFVSLSMPRVNIGSVALELSDLKTLSPKAAADLEERGITRPRQLLRAIENPDRFQGLAVPPSDLNKVEDELRLLTLKGIGRHQGDRLRRAGIESVSDLALADPGELYGALEQGREEEGFPALRPEMVRVWVDAARAFEPR
jgi:predicted flap endonuclease-1-like 5' DNA nuclease